MGYTYYNPLKVWLDPASIPDVVAHIQEYLTEYPLINQSDIEQIVVDYITAHPELVGGVDSVNGKTGEVVLTASDINTTNNTTIQAVINSLSADIADIVQSVTTLSGRVTANETGITNEATARSNADTALGNRITALQGAVGSPLIAATAAAMTDTSKIYVYTGSETGYTNGNWYYYNGSAWTSGGVYNAVAINTDTTLTVAGMAADAKATGDGLNDLKSSLSTFTGNETYPYTLDKSISYANPLTQSAEVNWSSVIIPCQEGDTFSVKGYGGNSTVLWMFSDSNGTLLEKSVGNMHTNDFIVITAPTGAAYLSCNTKYTEIDGEAVKGVVIKNQVALLDEKFGYLETSKNMFSNYADDWEQGDGNSSSYISRMKKTFPVLDGYLFFITDNSTIPETFTSNSQIAVRVYDSSDTLLGTLTKYFTNIAFVDVKDQYPTASYLRITVNSAVASVPVTPQIASSIKAYVGYKHIGSNITTLYDYDNYNVPQYARKVVDGGYLPDYWLDYLHNKAIDIAKIDEQIGGHGFSFAFITDQHWYSNYQKSPMILKWIKEHTNIDRFVGGGDVVTNHNSIEVAMRWVRDWANKTNGLKMRNVRGNHDNNSQGVDSQYWLGDDRFYSALIRPCENEVTIEDGHLYYYEKIDSQKVVIFYLDTGDMVNSSLIDFSAQITWMDSVVQTLDSDWSILVIQHVIFNGHDSSDNPVMYALGTQVKNYLDTVTNCNVIGVIAGHTHRDESIITENGYPMIATTCDASGSQARETRTEGTITEQAFDIFQIDTTNKKIYATRIGYGNDREWDY